MQIITEQFAETVDSMTNEDSSFPKENMITLRPGDVSKATGQSTTIGLTAQGNTAAFHNVYAVSGTITIKDNVGAVKTTGVNLSITATSTITRASGSFVAEGYTAGDEIFLKGFTNDANNGFFTIAGGGVAASTLTVTATSLVTEGSASGRSIINMENPEVDGAELHFVTKLTPTMAATGLTNSNVDVWYEFERYFSDCTVKLTLTGSSVYDPVHIGLVMIGFNTSFGRSQFGFRFGRQDLSIRTKTSSGSTANTTRPIIRQPQGTVSCEKQHAHNLQLWFDSQNQFGHSMKFTKDVNYHEDIVIFGFLPVPPVLRREKPLHLEYNVRAEEIL